MTRLQTNMDLLKKHQARNRAAEKSTIDVEVTGVRIGDFVLVTFPGELSVEIGLRIKKQSPLPFTFVAGYTNGYIYYTPTEQQRTTAAMPRRTATALWPHNGRVFSKRECRPS